tara:strand:- start:540 stop:941 length:402 start_codon:yes stop_codon:yes gene_type:complete
MTKIQKEKFKKYLLIIIISFFSLVFLVKFSLNFVENRITSTLKSKKFEVFMMNQFNNKLASFANKSVTEGEFIFYKDNFSKIYKKYKPIFDEIELEDITSQSNVDNAEFREKLKNIYIDNRSIFLEIIEDIEK